MYGYGSAIVSLLVLVSSIGIAIAATTATPSTVKSSRLSAARSVANNTTRKVVTFRQSFGTTDEQCQCVVFHLCDQNNVVSVPTSENQDRCIDDQVCCRIDPSSSPLPTDPPPQTSDPGQCICVPFWQCLDYQQTPVAPAEEENVENIINPRFRCEPPDFCCPPTSINHTTVVTDFTPVITPSPSPYTTADTTTQPSGSDVRVPVTPESPVPPSPSVEQECGIKGKNAASESDIDSVIEIGTKITNVNDANAETYFGEFPWMVALFRTNGYSSNGGELICGASLLSPYIVLTAAHCVNNIDMSLLRVRAGEYVIGSEENEAYSHQDRTVNAVHIHPNYNPKRLYNDMALLSVNEPFRYDAHINSICAPLAGSDFVAPNSYKPFSCWASGWGKSNFTDKNIQLKLKKVELPIVNRDECQSRLRTTKLGSKFTLDSSFLCAGGEPGYDSCKGDGGGPLFCATRSNENKFIQVGIVSWGVGCGSRIPGIYASLEANSDWLTTEINTMSVFRP